ncbi:hypothetical protein [Streptomyces sp. URMC 125]|uniref:hypothetical protein n=1 Tax=Streptomyces sp. URMC 125 TaxID=3423419 RepID=UPI003F19F619
MAVFKVRLTSGEERLVEAGRAARTDTGHILIEDTDSLGVWTLLETYEPTDVSAVYRRGPAESGIYTWIPQPTAGRWWSY